MTTRDEGHSGEVLARQFLEAHGLTFRAANVRSPFGEIDVVMEDPKSHELVFVEVKTRRGTDFGAPEEAVTSRKLKKLRALVGWYCARMRWDGPVRLDVVGVLTRAGGSAHITHTSYVG